MATEQFANNADSLLNGAITSGATSLVVTSATPFPTTGQFRVRIDSEILLVTAVSGTTFTVTRGAEGTAAAAHANLAPVVHTLTAGAIAQLKSDSRLYVLTAPPSVASLTWVNQGSASASDSGSGFIFNSPGVGSGNNRHLLVTTPTSVPNGWTHDIGFVPTFTATAIPIAGGCFRESSTSKLIEYDLYWSAGSLHVQFSKLSSPTAVSGVSYLDTAILSVGSPILLLPPMFIRMKYDTTNISIYWSSDGENWAQVDSNRAKNDFFTTAPDQTGLCFDAVNSTSANSAGRVFHWKVTAL